MRQLFYEQYFVDVVKHRVISETLLESKEMSKSHQFNVGMTCGGCESAISRILNRIDGIDEFKTDVDAKKVVIKGTFDHELVLAKLKKWGDAAGKTVEYAGEV